MSHIDLRGLDLNRDSTQPLNQQLARQISRWIVSGRLPAGSRLTASRLLAQELGTSRNTVNAAIDQLRAEGYLLSRRGSGVYVSDQLPQKDQTLASSESIDIQDYPPLSNYGEQLQGQGFVEHGHSLPFTPGVPDLQAFPNKIWRTLMRRHGDRTALLGYGGNQGYAPLRYALADYLVSSRGLRCEPGQIVITQGAQQGLTLCAQLLLNSGDNALIENPGYAGARKAFLSQGAKLQPIALSDNGLDLAQLEQAPTARLLYTTPTHQYPLGGILPAADRLKLLAWARHQNCWIIEDDYDSEFHYSSKPIAAMQGMATQTPVIYVGSFSKTLFPALRLGYLVLPKHLVGAFVQAKSFISGESPLLNQAVVADFIAEGHFMRHLRRMRLNYEQKWQHMRQLCEHHLNGSMTAIARSAGMHLALEATEQNLDDWALHREFRSRGFGSSSLSYYYHDEAQRKGLVLGFANTSEREREAGIALLSKLLR